MVTKLKEMMTPEQHALVEAACTSAHQVWAAGLGAFARAQKEGGELFDKLVQEGGELARLTQNLSPEKAFAAGGGAVSRLAENVGKQAAGSWEKLEKIFEERVARAMQSLNMPTRDDLDGLAHEVAQLKAQLAAQGAPARKTAARKTAAKAAAKAPAKLAAKGASLKDARARTATKRASRTAARHH